MRKITTILWAAAVLILAAAVIVLFLPASAFSREAEAPAQIEAAPAASAAPAQMAAQSASAVQQPAVTDGSKTEQPASRFLQTAAENKTDEAEDETAEEAADAEPALAPLQKQLDEELSQRSGHWCVTLLLEDGKSVTSDNAAEPDQQMIAASLIKLYIMGAVFQQIENGAIGEQDVSQQLEDMITRSDNDAANALIRRLGNGDAAAGMAAVNAFAAAVGCGSTALNRLLLDNNGLQNYTTTRDCAHILDSIEKGTCVSKTASAKMRALLFGQTRRNKIPAGLPETAECGNKTGELPGLAECDAAIVDDGIQDYILCVMSEVSDNQAAITEIVHISALCFQAVAQLEDGQP